MWLCREVRLAGVAGGGGIWNLNGDWWFFPGQGATEITIGNQGVRFVNNNGNLFASRRPASRRHVTGTSVAI